MFLSRSGCSPVSCHFVLARIAVLVVAICLGACSSRQASAPDPQLNYVAASPRNYVPIRANVELEDDGIEVQRPPVHRRRRAPDDPTEPFSPNYGAIDPGVAAMANESEPWIIPEEATSDFANPDGSYTRVPDGDVDDPRQHYDDDR